MKSFQHDQMMYEQGHKDEQENTERERQNAEQEKSLTNQLFFHMMVGAKEKKAPSKTAFTFPAAPSNEPPAQQAVERANASS